MPIIHHRYLTETFTNPQPPGFADFLRGTLALYQLAKKNNYELKLDVNSHPIFNALNVPEEYISRLSSADSTIEILPPIAYHDMHNNMQSYLTGDDIRFLTNAFYDENSLTDEYMYLQKVLQPTVELENHIKTIQSKATINFSQPYVIVHVRIGDKFLVDKQDIPEGILQAVRFHIQSIKQETNDPLLLIADSYKLKEAVKDLCEITMDAPIHTGSLDTELMQERVFTTLGEFFIMAKARSIYCINFWDGSGYSRICSKIYSIPYYLKSL